MNKKFIQLNEIYNLHNKTFLIKTLIPIKSNYDKKLNLLFPIQFI